MMRWLSVLTILISLLLFSSCAKEDAEPGAASHATVYMRDGSSYSGNVVTSSPTELTLAGDDKTTRTLAMRDVRSIEYDDTPAPQTTAASPQSIPASPRPRQPAGELNHERHHHPVESVINTRTHELPAATEISVRIEETIDSDKAAEGQTYPAEVTNDVLDANGDVVIPRGASAQIVIRSAAKGGRFRGTSDLVLDLQSVSVEGRQYQVSTVDILEKGKAGLGANKRTAEYTGGGAAIGAIIGAIAGHGKGAAIGAASGAAAGAATQVITKGGSIRVPVETVLTFKLDRPLRVSAR